MQQQQQKELGAQFPTPVPPDICCLALFRSLRRGPTLQDVLDEGEYELQPLPSDEAWFGEPDPSIYAAGTNDLTKEQLAEELAKGNVCTLRQLKQHLLTASESELEVRDFGQQQQQSELAVVCVSWCMCVTVYANARWCTGLSSAGHLGKPSWQLQFGNSSVNAQQQRCRPHPHGWIRKEAYEHVSSR